MDSARRATRPPPPGSRGDAGWPFLLKAQDDAVYVDRRGIGPFLPGEVRQREGGRPVEHRAIEAEARAVARTVEGLGVLVERVRAAQVRTVDGVHAHLAVGLDDIPAEGQIPRRVVATAVGHDECGVGAGWRIEPDRFAVRKRVDPLRQANRQGYLPLTLRGRGPQEDQNRRHPYGRYRDQEARHPPPYERAAGECPRRRRRPPTPRPAALPARASRARP